MSDDPEKQTPPDESATKTLTTAEAGEDILLRIFKHNQRIGHQRNVVITLRETVKEAKADYDSARALLDKMYEQREKIDLEVSDLMRRKQPEQHILDEKARIAQERETLQARAAELDAAAAKNAEDAANIRKSLDMPMPDWLPPTGPAATTSEATPPDLTLGMTEPSDTGADDDGEDDDEDGDDGA